METQKVVNLLNDSNNEESKFAAKMVFKDIQTANDKYNQNNSIKFETESIKLSLCDFSDAFILVTESITVNTNNDTDLAFKNCASFFTCKIEINDLFIDEAICILLQCIRTI